MLPRIRINALLTVASIILFLIPDHVWAWGPIGHRVSARAAQDRLTRAALMAIRNLFGTAVRLSDISTWADEQREAQGSGGWHYVNVPIRETRYSPRYCPASGCVVSKIEDFRRVLQNPGAGKQQKQEALKYLMHFIADLHQPLHVGDNHDQGGNLLQVRFFGIGSNLHRVWDSQVIERHTENENVWLWDIDFLANPRMVAEWSKGNGADWATESLQIAKEAYCLPGTNRLIRSGTSLGSEYEGFALPIIQKQLAKAGVRIAFVLNEIFK